MRMAFVFAGIHSFTIPDSVIQFDGLKEEGLGRYLQLFSYRGRNPGSAFDAIAEN